MNTTIEEIDGKYVATLEGEMDTAAAMEAEEVLKPLYSSNGKDVIIDCTNLEYISSSGLRLFLALRKETAAKGGKVIIKNINDEIKKVFMMTGFFNLFEIITD